MVMSTHVTILIAIGIALASLLVVVVLTVSTRLLLPIALVIFVLIPVNYLPVPQVFTVVTPAALPVLAWKLRVRSGSSTFGNWPNTDALVNRIVMLLVVVLLAVTAASTDLFRSSAWLIAFATLAWPIMTGRLSEVERTSLINTWVALSILMSLFAAIEHFSQLNPLSPLYARAPDPLVQVWSVYRVTTSLGHPLMNAMFFSMSFGLAFGLWMERRSPKRSLVAVCSMAGVALSVSRTGLIACAFAAVAVVGFAVLSKRQRIGTVVLALCGLAAAATVASQLSILSTRFDSYEGAASVAQRSESLSAALGTASQRHYLGSGPGTSGPQFRQHSWYVKTPTLENSYLELLVSIGVLGLVAFVCLLFAALLAGQRSRQLSGVGALIALAVCIAGFNTLEGNRSSLLLVGFAVLLCHGRVMSVSAQNSALIPRVSSVP